MKRIFVLMMTVIIALSLSSCWSTRTSVGGYTYSKKVDKESTYTFAKGKQVYLFWGLIPCGRTNVATPADGNCQIRTKHGFLDAFLTIITGGVLSMQTIKVNAPKPKTPNAAPTATTVTPQSPEVNDAELDAVKQLLQ